MNESEKLALELDKVFRGEAWYGPSWRELLAGLDRAAALTRPLPGAHSIAEIMLHAMTYHDVVRRLLEGETPEVSDEQDWPAASLPSAAAWEALVKRFFATAEALRATIARFPAERLHQARPGQDGSWYSLIVGEMQHILYHAGQVGLLKKAVIAAPV